MDAAITALLEGIPNLAVAVFVIWWSTRMIERDGATKDKLIDALLVMVKENKALIGEARTQTQAINVTTPNGT